MFVQNLEFLMTLKDGLNNESLAKELNFDQSLIESWINGVEKPTIEEALTVSNFFKVDTDDMFGKELYPNVKRYSKVKIEKIPAFRYVPYTVISRSPEDDALLTIVNLAKHHNVEPKKIIGWDFPFLSTEQQIKFRMRGYTAAYIIDDRHPTQVVGELIQPTVKYAKITIKDPMENPELLVPNAYSIVKKYCELNGLEHDDFSNQIECFETVYLKDNEEYMDVYYALKK